MTIIEIMSEPRHYCRNCKTFRPDQDCAVCEYHQHMVDFNQLSPLQKAPILLHDQHLKDEANAVEIALETIEDTINYLEEMAESARLAGNRLASQIIYDATEKLEKLTNP